MSQNELNAHHFCQQSLSSLIPLPKLVQQLKINDFDLIWTYLNLDSQFNWRWLAGKVGFEQREVNMIQGKSGNPSERFQKEWAAKGATTSQLLSLLAGKRVDIIEELAKSYIIP